jgi:peroxiredoxin family protein
METKIKKQEKEFDTVKTFRVIKEKISKDMSQMTLAQMKEYLRENSLKFQACNFFSKKLSIQKIVVHCNEIKIK